ncbi:MAG TPA: glycoside hydrolase family 2 TIM barrel-domain containing protein [Phnomibacter sp.]|nr:glycoside hydrolase family 2 TIM barrel-domain containing protein [Phnomibacter sp.]
MRTKKLSFILFLFIGFQALAQEQISLNGNWKFALAKTEKEAVQLKDFFQPDFAPSSFVSIPVPSNWAVLGFEEPVYRGFEKDTASEGFYLYDFNIPKGWAGKRLLLNFGGVWSSAEVWLNGVYVGIHESGYTSFSFNVSGKLKEDKPNKLAVRVRQISREYKFDVYDDWTIGGIYRDVSLEAMPSKRWLEYAVATTTFDPNYKEAELAIKCMVSDKHEGSLPGNYPSPGKPYDIRFTLQTLQGEKVAHRLLTIPAHTSTSREVQTQIHVDTPLHWTAETPNLYVLKIELLENGTVVQTKRERIGFRQISTTGGVFRINGQAVKLRGVNRHDEHPDVGRATTREHWLQDILLMKAANINYIRMAHYQHAKGFVELCDSLGMYVGEEVSIGGAGGLISDPSYSGAALVRTYETVTRDINNPSIIYWTIGNEDQLASLNLAAVKFVKALDPTRPTMIPWRHETWLPKDIDLLSAHYWQPHEYDQLASIADRPIITTEYTHAFGVNSMGGLDARWKALTKHPAGAGGAVWMWADQGIKTPAKRPAGRYEKIVKDDEYLRIDDQGWDGIVDSYRKPTRDYWEVKAVYAQVYPTINKIPFVTGQSSLSIPLQNDFDFTDLKAIKIEWIIKEDAKNIATGVTSIAGPPHTVATLNVPCEKLGMLKSGKAYYIWLRFLNESGQEIICKSVELAPASYEIRAKPEVAKIIVMQNDSITVSVNNINYCFNPKTGHLLSGSIENDKLIYNLKPTIWHKPDNGESSVIGSKIASKLPDLNKYNTKAKTWKLQENSDNVCVETTVEYTVDAKNSFTVQYKYLITMDGKLTVQYAILPHVETPRLPIVGMSLQTAPKLKDLHWVGLGPYDANPNKQAATIFGFWGGALDSAALDGNKATQSIELTGSNNKVRIANDGYMEHHRLDPNRVGILSTVLGKPEKGRKPFEPSLLLETNTGQPFVGQFEIDLEAIK